MPPGFAYFAVGFGLQAGYAHHVEDEATWPKDFGRDVLEGLLEHEVRAAALDPTRAAPPRRVAVSAEARCRVAACCRRDLLPTRPAAHAACCPRDLRVRRAQDTGIPLNRRKREDFAKVKTLISAFGQAFDPYDWTKAL